MNPFNVCQFIGRLAKDPEVKNFDNGGKIAKITVAVDMSYKDKTTGNKVERVAWVDCKTNKSADYIEEYFKKGEGVVVLASYMPETWTDKTDNKTKSRPMFIIEDIKHSLSNNNTAKAQAPQGQPAPAASASSESNEFMPDGGSDDLPF